jgi:ligand-binding sensor protein
MELIDLLPQEDWISLEKEIHSWTGLKAAIYDTEGQRITDYECRANNLCPAIRASASGGSQICNISHQSIQAAAARAGKPVVDECDAGMLKVVVPIMIDGEIVGTCSVCGLLLDNSDVDAFYVAKVTGMTEDEVEALSDGMERLTTAHAEALAMFLSRRVHGIVNASA